MIIEFISTPGAGKTTLMPVVTAFMNDRGYRGHTVLEAARPFARRTPLGQTVGRLAPSRWENSLQWQVFYQLSKAYRSLFLSRHARLMWFAWGFQQRRPISRPDRRHVWHWFVHLTGVYEFLRRHAAPEDALVFDEGFVHRVVQLFASEHERPQPDLIARYLRLVPQPDLVIQPVASLPLCLERVRTRGVWDRFKDKQPADLAAFMGSAETAVATAVDYIRAHDWPLITVDTSAADPRVAQAALWDSLNAGASMLERRHPQPSLA